MRWRNRCNGNVADKLSPRASVALPATASQRDGMRVSSVSKVADIFLANVVKYRPVACESNQVQLSKENLMWAHMPSLRDSGIMAADTWD